MPLDILHENPAVDLDETVQAQPEHPNIEELLMAQAPLLSQSETISAL